MGINPDSMHRPILSYPRAGTSSSSSPHPEREIPPNSTVPLKRLSRAFADGFAGGLCGGLLYYLVLACFYPDGLELVWLRVLVVSLALGTFEM